MSVMDTSSDKDHRYLALVIPERTYQALVTASVRESRRPKPQALVMLTAALREAGYLAPEPEPARSRAAR